MASRGTDWRRALQRCVYCMSIGALTYIVVISFDGPVWAAAGFGLVVFNVCWGEAPWSSGVSDDR
jgi:hypothetical protein